MTLLSAVFALLPIAVQEPAAGGGEDSNEKWESLFDGATLDGWTQHGGKASYRVEDGCIVGEVGPGPNTFLCTDREFGNFELELDLRLDVPGNSGIQIRSHLREAQDRVFGYQVEIDPSERAWSGGLYDEGRRGWLDPLEGDEAARAAFRVEGWNHYRIVTEGPHLRTWVNGIPCADLLDPVDMSGFLALQVHSGSQGKIRWRNLRIRDRGVSKWEPLFDGESLDGWHEVGGGGWSVHHGAIHGAIEASDPNHGLLVSDAAYSDFAVRARFQILCGDSGLYFRVEEGGGAGVLGFQAEIDDANETGGLYETGGRGWVVKPKAEDIAKLLRAEGEWNELVVIALGQRVAVYLNDRLTAELHDDPGRTSGHIALQLHGSQDVQLKVDEVSILEWERR